MSELPCGWSRVALKDVGTWYGGGTPSKSRPGYWANGTVPWLSPKDMGTDVLHGTQDRITEPAVAESSVKLVPAGSVAIVVRSGILERTLPVSFVPFETTLNQDMKAVVPRSDIDPRWVAWGLRAYEPSMLRELRKSGTTVASLDTRRLFAFEIPLPPLGEQRRIVAILEDHLSRLDAAGAALETASRRASRLGVSVIDEHFRESRDKHVRMSELLAEPMRNGHSASASLTGEGIRTLTLTAVTKNEFSDRYTKLTKADRRRVADLWLTAGDILVERANTPELVGTSALFAGPDHWAIFPDLMIRIRVRADRARPQFVAAALRSAAVRRFFRSRARGLAGSMPKIDQATVGAAAFPLPSLAAQDEFLCVLSQIDAGGTRLSRAADLADQRSSVLRRSLLAAAFSGQLT